MTQDDLLRVFGRHLVALCFTFRRLAEGGHTGQQQFFNCPGVILGVRGVHFYLTAGHILRHIDNVLRSEQVIVESSALVDAFGIDRVHEIPIPFNLRDHHLMYVDRDGFDYGLIHLSEHFVNLLRANNVRCVTEENWADPGQRPFSHFFMFGLPDEITSSTLGPDGRVFLGTALINVERLDSLPDALYAGGTPGFIGRINSELPFSNITGMSGGPIFGFIIGERIQYWTVALQSAWYSQARVVVGCPISIIARLVSSYMELASGMRREDQA